MRNLTTFTVEGLLALIIDEEGESSCNIKDYCHVLYKVGVLGKAGRTGAYYLAKNTGSLCPSWNATTRTVADRNTGEVWEINNERRY